MRATEFSGHNAQKTDNIRRARERWEARAVGRPKSRFRCTTLPRKRGVKCADPKCPHKWVKM